MKKSQLKQIIKEVVKEKIVREEQIHRVKLEMRSLEKTGKRLLNVYDRNQ